MQKKKSLRIKTFQFKFSLSCVFMLFHDMVTQTFSSFWIGHADLFMFLNWSLRSFHVFDMVTQTFSCFWRGHSDLFMFLTWSLRHFHVFDMVTETFSCFSIGHSDILMFWTWSLRPFHVFQLVTQTYSCFWHGHLDLFKFWHGHSDIFMFLTWSLRPSYVFDLDTQTYSCFWHGHLDHSMFLRGSPIPFHGFDMITHTFMIPFFSVIMFSSESALATSTSAASSQESDSTRQHAHLDILRRASFFHCGQGTCDYSSKVKSNVTRHQKSTCLRESRKEWKLRQRTCEQCGQVLMQAKFMKKHQLTKYCVKQRDFKRKGEVITMYKYSKWFVHTSKQIHLDFEHQIKSLFWSDHASKQIYLSFEHHIKWLIWSNHTSKQNYLNFDYQIKSLTWSDHTSKQNYLNFEHQIKSLIWSYRASKQMYLSFEHQIKSVNRWSKVTVQTMIVIYRGSTRKETPKSQVQRVWQDVFVFIRPANPHLQTSELQDTSELCKALNH